MSKAFWFSAAVSLVICLSIYIHFPMLLFPTICGCCLALLLNGLKEIHSKKEEKDADD